MNTIRPKCDLKSK